MDATAIYEHILMMMGFGCMAGLVFASFFDIFKIK